MRRAHVSVLLLLVLAACGDGPREGAAPSWRTCTLDGVRAAGGLAMHRGNLIVACGGNDRELRSFASKELQPGIALQGLVLKRQMNEGALLMGAEPFALQGYTMEQLWAQKLDFQALAVQPPHFVYIGDRTRRVVYWGTLTGDIAGRTDRVRIQGVFIVPGAKRTDTAAGDWRDRGPGLAGFVSIGKRRRTEDFYAIDRGAAGGGLRIHKVSRHGSVLGAIRVRHGFDGPLDADALSLAGNEFLIRHGASPGTLSAVALPNGNATVGMRELEAAPPPPEGHTWTGMCHGEDGTIYLVSSGETAVLAWRRR